MDETTLQVLPDVAQFVPPAAGEASHWIEHLRTRTMSVGTYTIPAGGVDDQVPHGEDELYLILSGRGILTGAGQQHPVTAGSAVFVPAGLPHRFVDVTADLSVLVVFAPAYSGRESRS